MRNYHIFGPNFSLAVMRAQCDDDDGGKILLGDNKGGGAD